MDILVLNSKIGEEYITTTHSKIKDGKFLIFKGCKSCNYSYKCKAFMKEENKDNDYRIKEIYIDYELIKGLEDAD